MRCPVLLRAAKSLASALSPPSWQSNPDSLTAFPTPIVLAGSLNCRLLICEQRLVSSLVAKYDSLFKGTRGVQKDLEGFPCSALMLQRGEQGGRQKDGGHNVLLLKELDRSMGHKLHCLCIQEAGV